MRKLAVLSLVLVSVLLLFSAATAQRINPGDGGNSSGASPVPVAVANFPLTQAVTGSVEVRNFPLMVTVQGTVDVRNLRFDENGNLMVSGTSGAPPALSFVGITAGTVGPDPNDIDNEFPVFECNRTCQAEFPGTRICLWQEMSRSIPTPDWSGCVLLATSLDGPSFQAACFDALGRFQFSSEPRPVACCGS